MKRKLIGLGFIIIVLFTKDLYVTNASESNGFTPKENLEEPDYQLAIPGCETENCIEDPGGGGAGVRPGSSKEHAIEITMGLTNTYFLEGRNDDDNYVWYRFKQDIMWSSFEFKTNSSSTFSHLDWEVWDLLSTEAIHTATTSSSIEYYIERDLSYYVKISNISTSHGTLVFEVENDENCFCYNEPVLLFDEDWYYSWSNYEIRYYNDSLATQHINWAISMWESVTDIEFIEVQSEHLADLVFEDETDPPYVGYFLAAADPDTIFLDIDLITFQNNKNFIPLHEIGHALGLAHYYAEGNDYITESEDTGNVMMSLSHPTENFGPCDYLMIKEFLLNE